MPFFAILQDFLPTFITHLTFHPFQLLAKRPPRLTVGENHGHGFEPRHQEPVGQRAVQADQRGGGHGLAGPGRHHARRQVGGALDRRLVCPETGPGGHVA